MKVALYRIWQCTWGFLQTLLGFFTFLLHIDDKHYHYHGAIVTEWKSKSSVSLGMFVFITAEPYFYEKLKEQYTMEMLSSRLLVHEYGHTIQSMVLGPWMLLVGIISVVWGALPYFERMRREKKLPYTACFVEAWASKWGEWVTGEKALW